MTHITVRDGRAGHVKGPDGLGPVLGVTQAADLLDIDDVVALPDGTRVIVTGVEDVLGGEAEGMDPVSQTVFVGTLPQASATP
jgi:hypothetical protein